MIAVLSETTGDAALQYMRKQMQATAEGREVLALQVHCAVPQSRWQFLICDTTTDE
jgi:hypothetical protein